MEKTPGTTRRSEKLFDSTLERVSSRIENLAAEAGFTVAFRDGAPEGVLQFYILHDDFKIANTEKHTAFLNQLRILDTVLTEGNTQIIEESGYEAFIEVEPRKDMK